jgi:two-component system cell cycle response regulator DivK
MLIEDNLLNARLAQRLLLLAGHIVQVAYDGADGLTQALATPPDIVLLDLGLPDIDGQTVAVMMRQQSTLDAARIIAFTAWPEEMARDIAHAYGCDGVIFKPIDTQTFAQVVGSYVDRRESA